MNKTFRYTIKFVHITNETSPSYYDDWLLLRSTNNFVRILNNFVRILSKFVRIMNKIGRKD